MEGIEADAMEFMSRLGRTYGLGELHSRVIGFLYIEPEEVSMEDIANRTGYSLASISNTMKMLEAVGMVKRIKKPGTKKVFFYMEKNLTKLNIMKLNAIYNNFLKPVKETLPKIIDRYRDKVKDEKSKKKLRIMEDYYVQLLQFEEIIKKWITDLEELSAKSLSFEEGHR